MKTNDDTLDLPKSVQGMGEQFVRMTAVVRLLSISRPTIYRLISRGEFPKPVKIGSCNFFVKSEIAAWHQRKIAERD